MGLGLTFDEFGMWLHPGGPYRQRASPDAVVPVAGGAGAGGVCVVAAAMASAASCEGLMVIVVGVFGWMLYTSAMDWAGRKVGQALWPLEQGASEGRRSAVGDLLREG